MIWIGILMIAGPMFALVAQAAAHHWRSRPRRARPARGARPARRAAAVPQLDTARLHLN